MSDIDKKNAKNFPKEKNAYITRHSTQFQEHTALLRPTVDFQNETKQTNKKYPKIQKV